MATIIGTTLDDTLIGTAADDVIDGGAGNDILLGLQGNDVLIGGTGSDTYLFNLGDGQDTIFENGGELDTIRFGAGIAASDITFARSGVDNMDLVLGIVGTTDQITIQGWGYGDPWRIDCIEFADGTIWGAFQIAQLAAASSSGSIDGTEGDDVLVGTDGNDIINGLGGNDVLNGGLGDDTLNGGDGNDILDGGMNWVWDPLAGNWVWDYVTQTVVWDQFAGNWVGVSGSDTLNGGAGNDTLIGNGGMDTYLFGAGSGQDTIDLNANYSDGTIQLTGLAIADVTISRAVNNPLDLVLSINGTTDSLTIRGYYTQPGNFTFQFTDGTLDQNAILALPTMIIVEGTEGADVLYAPPDVAGILNGNGGDDILVGGGSNDTLNGGDGNDILMGGGGNDLLVGGNGQNIYLFGVGGGQDTIGLNANYSDNIIQLTGGLKAADATFSRSASNAMDLVMSINGTADSLTIRGYYMQPGSFSFEFIDGVVDRNSMLIPQAPIDYDNILMGSEADDILSGGAGNDLLVGGYGNNTYLFGTGSGNDTIRLAEDANGSSTSIVQLIGLSIADVTASCVGDDRTSLQLTINSTGETLTIENYYMNYNPVNTSFQFIDGTLSDYPFGGGASPLTTGYAEVIRGAYENDILVGSSGNDYIDGFFGDDILDGGAGDDLLIGGPGYDTYVFGAGSGHDTIDLIYMSSAGVIDMSTLAIADVTLTRAVNKPNDLLLTVNSTGDSLAIKGYFLHSAGYSLEFRLSDGTLNFNDLKSLPAVFDGTDGMDALIAYGIYESLSSSIDVVNATLNGKSGDDLLIGAFGNNLLDGGAGNDLLTGKAGNDLFIGGAGNDTIATGDGAGIICFNRGDGQDTVSANTVANNTISLGGGINYADLAISKSGNDLVLSTGGIDQIALQNWFGDTPCHSVANLQIVLDAATYDANSADPLLNQKVQNFDFTAIVQAFDQAQAADPDLTSWNVIDALQNTHLTGSDIAALGGDLAYQYNLTGSLAFIGIAATQDVMGDANFGVSSQQF